MGVSGQAAEVALVAADSSASIIAGWLDLFIFSAYVAIPLQLLWITMRPPRVFDHNKISATLSSPELARTRILALSFASFIVACGIGHGLHASAELLEDYADRLQPVLLCSKFVTCIVSIGTSLALGLWIPSLLTWVGEIEVHRSGFTKLCLAELQGAEAGIIRRGEKGRPMEKPTEKREHDERAREEPCEDASAEQRDASMALLAASFDVVVTLNGDLRLSSQSPHLQEAFKQPSMDRPLSAYATTEEERGRLATFLRGVQGGEAGAARKLAVSFVWGCEAQVTAARAGGAVLCGLRWTRAKHPEADPAATLLTEAALSQLGSHGPRWEPSPPGSAVSNGSAAASSSAVVAGGAPQRALPSRNQLRRWSLAARDFFHDHDVTQCPEVAAAVEEFWEHLQNQMPDPQLAQILQGLTAPDVTEAQRLWLILDRVATTCAEGPHEQFEMLSRVVVVLGFLLESVLGPPASTNASAPFAFSATGSTCSTMLSSLSSGVRVA